MPNNLEWVLENAAINWRHPRDLDVLLEVEPRLATYTRSEIARAYEHWCEEFYCAGWLIVTSDTAKEFADWALAKHEE